MAKRVHQVDLKKPPKPVSSSSSKSSCSNGESPPAPAKKLSFSIAVVVVVISVIPLLYLSLLQYHSSPSSVVHDTKFWFLMSNAIILIVAADSGMFAGSAAFRDRSAADVYGPEYYCVKLDRPKINAGSGVPPELAGAPSDDDSAVVEIKQVLLAVSAKEKKGRLSSSSSSEYAAMSDDELNRRVEEFIRRFNREIRQQEWS